MTKIEIKKTARSPQFRIALILVSLVGLLNLVMVFLRYLRMLPAIQANLLNPLYAVGNPNAAVFGMHIYEVSAMLERLNRSCLKRRFKLHYPVPHVNRTF